MMSIPLIYETTHLLKTCFLETSFRKQAVKKNNLLFSPFHVKPPENIRKPEVFLHFSAYRKIPVP